MKNTIIDGVEYAVNLNGEQYEVMIPGTKCPVSADSLRQRHLVMRIPVWEIHIWMQREFGIIISRAELLGWFQKSEIETWSSPKDTVNVNSLRNTICPVCPTEIWDMYHQEQKSTRLIASDLGTASQVVQKWMDKAGIPKRSLGDSIRTFINQNPERRTALSRKCREQWADGVLLPVNKDIQKIANIAANQSPKRKRATVLGLKCNGCGKLFERKKHLIDRAKKNGTSIFFCSVYCRSTFRKGTSEKTLINGLICPHCSTPTVKKHGIYRKFSRFDCSLCRRYFINPIIEFGLRQDLEAAGVLEDGRILAIAFVTEKEKATAS